MALTYIGDCSWQQAGEPQVTRPPNEPGMIRDTWIGRTDQVDSFLSTYAIGSVHLGGYIVDNTPRDQQPSPGLSTVELIIVTPPPFTTPLVGNQTAIKTATRSATVTTSTVIDGATAVQASRQVTYEAPESTYSYFASSKPDGPRYNTAASALAPRVLSSTITARGDVAGGSVEKIFTGALAPSALVSALAMPTVEKVTSHRATPISGTPWYQCEDVVTREMQGDT